jgi:hypothetical protein
MRNISQFTTRRIGYLAIEFAVALAAVATVIAIAKYGF